MRLAYVPDTYSKEQGHWRALNAFIYPLQAGLKGGPVPVLVKIINPPDLAYSSWNLAHSNRAPRVMRINGCAVARCSSSSITLSPATSDLNPCVIWIRTQLFGYQQIRLELYRVKFYMRDALRRSGSQSILFPSTDNNMLLWIKEDLHLLNNSRGCIHAYLLRLQGAGE